MERYEDLRDNKYKIVKKCVKNDHWQVWWDDTLVYEANNPNAQHIAHIFAKGLEQGILGSKQSLGSNSKIRIEGWMDYLGAFDSYEEYR